MVFQWFSYGLPEGIWVNLNILWLYCRWSWKRFILQFFQWAKEKSLRVPIPFCWLVSMIHIYIYIYIYTYLCIHVYVSMYMSIYIGGIICLSYMYIYIYIYMYSLYIYIYMYIHCFLYIYNHLQNPCNTNPIITNQPLGSKEHLAMWPFKASRR